MLGDYSLKIKDQVLAYGELLSAAYLVKALENNKIEATVIDARKVLKTDANFGNANVLEEVSKENIQRAFSNLSNAVVPVITGFIGTTEDGKTTTLGRMVVTILLLYSQTF